MVLHYIPTEGVQKHQCSTGRTHAGKNGKPPARPTETGFDYPSDLVFSFFLLSFFPSKNDPPLLLSPRRCAGLWLQLKKPTVFLLLSARRASERTAPYLHLARTQPSALIGCGLPPYHANHYEDTLQRFWRHRRPIFSY